MLFQISLFYLLIRITVADPVTPEQNVQVCDNEQCKVAAEILSKAMNKSVDPCEDFYAYSCGGWESNFPLPSNKDIWNLDKIVENDAIIAVKEILEEEETIDDPPPLVHEKMWYKSCMDLDSIEEAGVKPVEEILDYLGGWPIVMGENWNSDDHDWQKIHEYYSSFRELSSLFDIRVAVDDRNSLNNSLTLFKPSASLYETLLKNKDEMSVDEKFTEFVKNVALIFVESANETISDEEILKDIEELLAFESNLHLIKSTAEETEDLEPSRVYVTIKELQDFYDEQEQQNETSKINWLQVFTAACKNANFVIVDESTVIGVDDKYYLRKLVNLLDTTPNRVIVNYVHWKFIASSLKYLNKEVRDLLAELTSKPDEATPERWEECISDMRFRMGYIYAYAKKHNTKDTKKMIKDMANELRSMMLEEIEHSEWVDPDTKEEAMIKLHGLHWLLGSPWSNVPKGRKNRYALRFTITPNYFENVQLAREFWMKFYLRRLRFRNNRKFGVRVNPLQSLAVYDRSRNELVLTSAQLANPLLQSTLPLSMHYGYMAPTLGHLMAQSMEKEVNTNVYMTPWSSYLGETYKSYEPKTACLQRQYNSYSVGPATVDDNMYNAIGLKVAYEAFQANVEGEMEIVEKLPELEELTNDQLFFVSYALKYCQAASPQYLDEHDPAFFTPSDYKVIGTLSNFEYFAKAFNCPAGSFMNPQDKCVI